MHSARLELPVSDLTQPSAAARPVTWFQPMAIFGSRALGTRIHLYSYGSQCSMRKHTRRAPVV